MWLQHEHHVELCKGERAGCERRRGDEREQRVPRSAQDRLDGRFDGSW